MDPKDLLPCSSNSLKYILILPPPPNLCLGLPRSLIPSTFLSLLFISFIFLDYVNSNMFSVSCMMSAKLTCITDTYPSHKTRDHDTPCWLLLSQCMFQLSRRQSVHKQPGSEPPHKLNETVSCWMQQYIYTFMEVHNVVS